MKNSMRKSIYRLASILIFTTKVISADTITTHQEYSDAEHSTVFVHMSLDPQTSIFADTFSYSVDDPGTKINKVQPITTTAEIFDPARGTTRAAYTQDIDFVISVQKQPHASHDAKLHIYYMQGVQQKPAHLETAIIWPTQAQPGLTPNPLTEEADRVQDKNTHSDSSYARAPSAERKAPLSVVHNSLKSTLSSIKNNISNVIEHSTSLWLRLLLIFLLGLLMSLTPCIYPMIPVTVGLLQPSSSSSLLKNFTMAITYTLGIATTFALLGLIVASGSAHLGVLMNSPIFIILVVLVLGYLGLSMFDFYALYIPRSFQNHTRTINKGSLLSVFLFGAASGTMASPCLSPGLALVLAIVAKISHKLFGFLFLFVFGIGSSIPLLLVGTFSSSLTILPRAGSWMNEVKKIFGLMLLGTCLFYLQAILPTMILMVCTILFFAFFGIYYARLSVQQQGVRIFHMLMSILCIGLSVATTGIMIKDALQGEMAKTSPSMIWQTDFDVAIAQARSENKKILLDFGASWCNLCHTVDRVIFGHADVQQALAQLVPLRVDCSQQANGTCPMLLNKFDVHGFPHIALYDVEHDMILVSWGSELLDHAPEMFAQELIERIAH